MSEPPDELDWIAALRPLTRGAPAALGLMDDAAVLPSRPDHDLVITEDAMVEGVHFLMGESADIVARRLLRTNLSDLAAKAAEPFGYTLMTAWPAERGWHDREAFIRGLGEELETYGVIPLGGDTVSTSGPLTVSATMFGWVPSGKAVKRSGAKPGDALVVIGTIGDGLLGLRATRGEVDDPHGDLARHYRLPEPWLGMRSALRAHASAAADVSDGLLIDVVHIADASNVGARLDLDRMPLSSSGHAWLTRQPDRAAAALELASGGDDYALVCAAAEPDALISAVHELGGEAVAIGAFTAEPGLEVLFRGRPLTPDSLGWRHR